MVTLMQTTPGGGADAVGMIVGLFFIVVVVVLVLSIWGMIFKKAGYSFWLCLLMVVPLANLIWLLIFAFSKWPVLQELELMKQRHGYSGSGFPVMPQQPQSYPPPIPPAQR